MAAQGWQDELARRAEEGSARLREVLSLGLGFLRSELGLDLGLEPRRYPGWVILVGTAALGLLLPLLLCYGWAAACAGARRKRRSPPRRREEAAPAPAPAPGPDDAGLPRSLRGDEPKKRSRKKAPDKPKPNGRTVEVADEEVVRTPRNITAKQPLETDKKNEKSKKNKKKSKSDAKAVQNSSRHDGKEVDEGAWETKISHREKRQQRKRDKVQTDSGSLDSTIPGIENTITVTTEQLTTASFPVGSKKNKGDSHLNVQVSNFKSGKGDSTLQVSSGLNENLTVNGGGWNEKSVKLSSQISAGEEKWNSVSPASAGKRKSEPSAWGQDTGDANANGKDWGRSWSDRSIFSGIAAWSSVDRGMNTSEQNSASFASLTLNSAVSGSTAEPVSHSTTSDYQWDVSRNQPYIDDEWSGLNGLSSADPSSDWNAPAEEWGNWVDEERASLLKSQEPIPDDQKVSDDDKEKGEGALPTGKSKKKKKKKKKQSEDNSPAQDTEELEKEIREELPVNTSKVRPKQEKAFSLKTISTSDPAEALIKNSQPIKTLPPAISTEPSVILSKSDSDKSSSQVPPILQETDKSKSNTKQNSVPPSQTKSETNWESPKQIKKKKKARRET
ncbi:protein LYRIC isoform X1 [Canis lupus baileyi]|uniref:Metadherin n=1 Tax=Canis lupus dingo TaxID=286419 RepID=A0A8C0KA58_CANLU|nr:protein LYRIC isoform X1 [Canis lupus dingo]XP_038297617.1 LOW QUALITY PROTEIN: protein LYRIC isoform X1 [Canis lupus familiaris]XP_038435762.1 protein LYRIC isoform X1 [Canis lupus familiaris]|eukprot:XP_005638199.1 protein LYRIC isoform X1 [Canis lupus familiaris]